MTQVLANFIQVLRAASIRVSTAESIDAAAALRVKRHSRLWLPAASG